MNDDFRDFVYGRTEAIVREREGLPFSGWECYACGEPEAHKHTASCHSCGFIPQHHVDTVA